MVKEKNYKPKIKIIADDEQGLGGFDTLWETNLEDAKKFIKKTKIKSKTQKYQVQLDVYLTLSCKIGQSIIMKTSIAP